MLLSGRMVRLGSLWFHAAKRLEGLCTMATIRKSDVLGDLTVIPCVVNGKTMNLVSKQFKSGKVGYNATGKVDVVLPPVKRTDWHTMQPINIRLAGIDWQAVPGISGSGSFNFNLTTKLPRQVGNGVAMLQVGANVTVIDSKTDAELTGDSYSCQVSVNATAIGSDKWAD